MRGLHFTVQYRDGLRWWHGRSYGLEYDLKVLEKMCELWHKQDAKHRQIRVLLMPINFLIHQEP